MGRLDINYQAYPEEFSNRSIVDVQLIDAAAKASYEPDDDLSGEDLYCLSILIECIVFTEGIILADQDQIVDTPLVSEITPGDSRHELIGILESEGVIEETTKHSASNTLAHEIANLVHPSRDLSVFSIHNSHIGYQWNDDEPDSMDHLDDDFDVIECALDSFSLEYRKTIASFDYFRHSPNQFSDSLRAPWLLLSRCHGVPYISDPLYSLRDLSVDEPTNIGLDLYRRIHELNKPRFEQIRRYLGPTSVAVPSLLSMALHESKSPSDIPRVACQLRSAYKEFRKKCTDLELSLRTASSIGEQFSVLDEINSCYSAIRVSANASSSRILHTTFDVVKNLSPAKIGMSALDKAREYDLERQAQLRIPGLFNLWKSSLDLPPGNEALVRHFGLTSGIRLGKELNKIEADLRKSAPPGPPRPA